MYAPLNSGGDAAAKPSTRMLVVANDEDQKDTRSFVEGSDDEGSDKPKGDIIVSIAKSEWLEKLVAGVILLNTLIMALEADYPKLEVWWYVEQVLLLFFISEIGLRLYAQRLAFFTDPKENKWNMFDATIVMFGVVDNWVLKRGSRSIVTVLRVVRILRILRMLRILRTFKELLLLVNGLIQSLKVVFWIAFLFGVVIVMVGIFCTMMIGHRADDYHGQDREDIETYFGTVPRSMLTMFQFVTLDNWTAICNLVSQETPIFKPLFVIYVMLNSFTVLSLLTGVVSEGIMKVMKEDDEAHESADLQKFKDDVKDIFKQLDTDGTERITRSEFQRLLSLEQNGTRQTEAMLLQWNIEVLPGRDVCDIFDILDVDENLTLTEEEFRLGLLRMRGEAKAKDVATLMCDVERMHLQLDDPDREQRFLIEAGQEMDALLNKMENVYTSAGRLCQDFSGFMDFLGKPPKKRGAGGRPAGRARDAPTPDAESDGY